MACGAYHSMVVLGEPSKTFKKVRILSKLNIDIPFIGSFNREIRKETRK